MGSRRILVVDDSPTFLASVASLLAAAEGVEVVGTAGSGREALERVTEMAPELVLMDVDMPEMSGLEAARRLAGRAGRTRVVLMTAHAEAAYRRAALRAGADGFLRKDELGDRLLPLIRALLPGCPGDGDADDSRSE